MGKKNKKNHLEPNINYLNGNSPIDKKFKKSRKEKEEKIETLVEIPTVSIAVAGSIIDNTQSLELATRLAGQIARAATIFRIDEVVVFDNKASSVDESSLTNESSDEDESGAAFLIRILTYLETPQYLRRTLFPMHNSSRFVGLFPPLDTPHHLRKHEWAPYREGVALKERPPNSMGSLVDVGLSKNVVIDQVLEPGRRVTVEMGNDRNLDPDFLHQIVSFSKPREELGTYWGYKVRYASSLSSVSKDCPYKDGYDYMIGTSEHGLVVKSSELFIPSFRHLLISFGGLAGLEESVEEDNNLKEKDVREPDNPNRRSRFHISSVFPRANRSSIDELQVLSGIQRSPYPEFLASCCKWLYSVFEIEYSNPSILKVPTRCIVIVTLIFFSCYNVQQVR